MRSIDNLREYALTAASVNATTRAVLAGYIDEIEREVDDMVPLPVDADGEAIHVGDSIEIISGESGTCVAVELLDRGDWLVSMRPTGWDTATLFTAEQVRHHRVQTVEDVILDAISRCVGHSPEYWDKPIAECAARLQLKEG